MNKFIILLSFIIVTFLHLLVLKVFQITKIEQQKQPLSSSILIQLSKIEKKNEVIQKENLVKNEIKKQTNPSKNIKQIEKNVPIQKNYTPNVSKEEFIEKNETSNNLKIEENKNTQEENLKENISINKYISELREEINKNKSYPNISKRLKEQGKILISFRVLKNGVFTNVTVIKSSNYQRLDYAALDAIYITKEFRAFDKEINKEYLDLELPLEFITIN